jgi:hypothetical protein
MRSLALVVAVVVVVVVVAGGAKARRRGLVDNDDDDEDDIVASVDRSASDGRLNADRRISMIFAVVAKRRYLLWLLQCCRLWLYSMISSVFLLSFLSWS